MKAWRVHRLGEPTDVLRLEDVPEPGPAPGELLVRVRAAALNFPDVLFCRGEYQQKPSLPFIPGFEIAGEVVVGGTGTETTPGTRVAAMCTESGGGFGECVVIPERAAMPLPDAMPDWHAAALPIAYLTGHSGLHRRAGVVSGETVLVHGGAGGVGTAIIQIARAAGARVVATAGGARKVAVCQELGADLVIDYREHDFVAPVLEFTGGRGADVIMDQVGGDVFDRSRKCIAFEGRIVIVGFTGGRIAQAPTNHALMKNYSIMGLHWARYGVKAPEVVADTYVQVLDLYRAGKIQPLVSEVLEIADVPAALARFGTLDVVGKMVVSMSG